jgi:hypothetical protein
MPHWSTAESIRQAMDPANIACLNDLLKQCDAKIVVSSSWRTTLRDMRRYLQTWGVRPLNRLLSSTPRFTDLRPRGDEIHAWLTGRAQDSIESFVIIDDQDDIEPYMARLVQTDRQVGLTPDNVTQALMLLGARRVPARVARH